MYKFSKAIPCKNLVTLLDNMLTNRRYQVFMGCKGSKWRTANNDLPQASVLAPTLFNLYLHDIPKTKGLVFQYADDIAIVHQSRELKYGSNTLNDDLATLGDYFYKWRLKPNPTKTEVCAFHLNNKQAYEELEVVFNGVQVQHSFKPKYLGITLDRSLTFKEHIEKTTKKLHSHINIIQKLAGTGWGADGRTLRTATLVLVYSTAEYGAQVWCNSTHTKKIDTQLNSAMRIVSGTVKSTPTQWLPVLTNIMSPTLRRKEALLRTTTKADKTKKSLLYQMLINTPNLGLKSRKPPWSTAKELALSNFEGTKEWCENWKSTEVKNRGLVSDLNKSVEGMDLSRDVWSVLNRIRTGHGRCGSMMSKWVLRTALRVIAVTITKQYII
ncbi:Uncharacterized protein FWK35_00024378 [Aphis craccivora]|uniref:Reverse transcriptase domain-containing protein n=1 Tax=Aphis craccivora TaxID=307492 RepID=A0A6G0Y5G5_APHCR|nr:Uncharacterized protein FWK35_00024378 [Aphis craccivora]